jgi:GntR family galactonate operon transcriptional repressor
MIEPKPASPALPTLPGLTSASPAAPTGGPTTGTTAEPVVAPGEISAAGGAGPAWPRRPQRLATAVVASLVDRIVGGELAQGSTMPTELALCETFGVSRTVIREAVKSLEAMRLAKVQQGQGTTVQEFAEWDLLNPVVLAATVRHDAELSILEDLIDVRRALEAQMAAQAAVRATKEQLTQIKAAMGKLLAEVDNPARYLQADQDFHDAIMAASGNRLGRAAIHTITAEAFRSLRYVGDPSPDDCRESNIAHAAVLEAVVGRDGDKAWEAMDNHILGSWRRRRPSRSMVDGSES